MIKVSVIVPVYKVPLKYLRACLDSLTAQTLQECEFIVVSDGAPEAECAICEEFTIKDPRFKFFQQKHSGVSTARNHGIDQVQGEYITFVDADDWIEKETCEKTYKYAKENNSDIVLWEAETTNNNHHEPLFSQSINKIESSEIHNICRNCIFTANSKYYSVSLVSCKLFSRTFIKENHIYYPTELQINEDRIFNINAYAKANKISYLNQVLYYYRIHSESTSQQFIPNAFYKATAFLNILEKKMQHNFSRELFKEYIRSFFCSWKSCYMHPQNKESFVTRTSHLSHIIKSDEFQNNLQKNSFKDFSFDVQIELFLFKHRLTFPIYINAIKSLIFKK